MVRSDVSLSVRQVHWFVITCLKSLLIVLAWLKHRMKFLCNLIIGTCAGCFTRMENYSCQHSKDSEGNNACFDGYSYFIPCIVIYRETPGAVFNDCTDFNVCGFMLSLSWEVYSEII